MSAWMYRADLQKIAGYTVLLRQTVRCVEDSYLMEGYPSLVKGTVLKTVRSFAARGFEPHTFLIMKKRSVTKPKRFYNLGSKHIKKETTDDVNQQNG